MHGGGPGACGCFVGREREVHLLGALARRIGTRGGAVVVRGEAGVGKTALLERVAAESGARTERIRGFQAEEVLPYVAVTDLLLPLRAHFAELPGVQRDAVEASMALRTGGPGNPLAVCAATLGVLAAAGRRAPLLVLVDDLQWVDPASSRVLQFVARRLATERVLLLFGLRDRPGPVDAPVGIPTVDLGGLSEAESRTLVAAQDAALGRQAVEEIVERSSGNPLALLETVSALPSGASCGAELDTGFGSPGPTLRTVWGCVVDALPQPTRTALFAIAAGRPAGVRAVEPVLAALGGSLDDLVPAERIGLVAVRDGTPRLRSALLRWVVEDRTPLATRLLVHRALAEHAEAEQRVWHVAACAVGPDEPAARDLVEAAEAARGRGAHRTAARIWRRAAELTPDRRSRAERLLAAATDAYLAGRMDAACGACDEALSLRSEPLFAADVALVQGRAVAWAGHPQRALDGLVRAGDAVLAHDPRRARRLHAESVLPAVLAGRGDLVRQAAARCARVAAGDSEGAVVGAAAAAAGHAFAGGSPGPRPVVSDDRAGADSRCRAWDLEPLVLLAQCRTWLEDHGTAAAALDALVEQARRQGSAWLAGLALAARAELGWWTGHWAAATADAAAAVRCGEELRLPAVTAAALSSLARLDASRGDAAGCRAALDRALRESGAYGLGRADLERAAVLGLSSLGAGDPAEAVEHLEQAWRAAQAAGLAATTVVPFVGDLVEAHVRCGSTSRAEEVLAALEQAAATTGLVFPAAAAARCRGLLADHLEPAERAFAEAARLHARRPVPFERARTLLCSGEVLRRLRRPAAARPVLREALSVFEGLGARPWAARAETELAATGVHRTPRCDPAAPGLAVLTPQELQIARVVADGLNNAEAAAVLYLSRKTVEAHLTRVYRKLGLRSRSDLARFLAPLHAAPSAPAPGPSSVEARLSG
ncbi:AAA family ATPase [Geodermatophilus sp. CPCC 205761]|uniref:AAA family ATPase n=1 Tax=Geodermatophilus sp. CPCC 205761 TaxID=2936597 RepID=UPI003F536A1D